MLKGARLGDGRYRPIAASAEADGSLRFRSALGLELRLERDVLRFFDLQAEEYLQTDEEARVAAEEARAEGAAHRAARIELEQRVAALEARLAESPRAPASLVGH